MYQNFILTLKALPLVIVGIFLPSLLNGQDHYVDSLNRKLEMTRGEERWEVLKNLFSYYYGSDYQKSIDYANNAYAVATHLGDSMRMVRSGRMQGMALEKIGRIDESIMVYKDVLSIAQRNSYDDQSKYLFNSLGISYMSRGQFDKALEYYLQTLAIREKQDAKDEISLALNNIGVAYFKLKDYERALDNYNRALSIKEEIGDMYLLEQLIINKGLVLVSLKKYPEAVEIINRAFEICGLNCDDIVRKEGYFGLGSAYLAMKNYNEAKTASEKSLELARKQNDKVFILFNLETLSAINMEFKDWEASLESLDEAINIANKTQFSLNLIHIYRSYSTVYDTLGDYRQASMYREKYIQLKDSIYSADLIKNLARVQTEFEERENMATIAAKEEVIKRQERLNFAIGIIAVLATLLIFVLYRSNLIKKRVNNALSDAKATIEAQNRELSRLNKGLEKTVDTRTAELQVSNASLHRVNAELDNFIYKTSHDIRGPLASLKGMCNVAIMDVKDETALGYLKKLEITAERLNTILTRLLIINQINHSTPGKDPIDFDSMVNDVILLEKKKGMPPRFKIDSEIQERITFFSDKELIRIILENLIDNAIKFHNDSERINPFVRIVITKKDSQIDIRVIDNGIGIDAADAEKVFQMFSRASERSETGGIGLYLTRTATEKLGGTVKIGTTEEGFTEFRVRF